MKKYMVSRGKNTKGEEEPVAGLEVSYPVQSEIKVG
jgi:hypothetical protein